MHDIFILIPVGVGLDISALLDCYVFIYKIFGHPIYSRHNAKNFLGLAGSNFFGVIIIIFFFATICLNICMRMSASSS